MICTVKKKHRAHFSICVIKNWFLPGVVVTLDLISHMGPEKNPSYHVKQFQLLNFGKLIIIIIPE